MENSEKDPAFIFDNETKTKGIHTKTGVRFDFSQQEPKVEKKYSSPYEKLMDEYKEHITNKKIVQDPNIVLEKYKTDGIFDFSGKRKIYANPKDKEYMKNALDDLRKYQKKCKTKKILPLSSKTITSAGKDGFNIKDLQSPGRWDNVSLSRTETWNYYYGTQNNKIESLVGKINNLAYYTYKKDINMIYASDMTAEILMNLYKNTSWGIPWILRFVLGKKIYKYLNLSAFPRKYKKISNSIKKYSNLDKNIEFYSDSTMPNSSILVGKREGDKFYFYGQLCVENLCPREDNKKITLKEKLKRYLTFKRNIVEFVDKTKDRANV